MVFSQHVEIIFPSEHKKETNTREIYFTTQESFFLLKALVPKCSYEIEPYLLFLQRLQEDKKIISTPTLNKNVDLVINLIEIENTLPSSPQEIFTKKHVTSVFHERQTRNIDGL